MGSRLVRTEKQHDRKKIKVNWKRWGQILFALLLPMADFYLLEAYTHNPFTTMGWKPQLWNILFFEGFLLFWLFVTTRVWTALTVTTVLSMVVGLGNCYVMRFRENPIVPWDIFSIKTAASVADNYSFVPSARMVWVTIGFLILLILGRAATAHLCLPWKELCKTRASRIGVQAGTIFLAAAILAGFTAWIQPEKNHYRQGLYDKLFTPIAMMEKDGFAVTFLIDLQYLLVEKPAGYSAAEEQAILEAYADTETTQVSDTTASQEYPDIVVIMDEAFSDMGILGELHCNEDYMPYIHSLQQTDAANVVTGYLNVSVLGGNTANTEYEFLTGNSMAFLPAGSVPYQQYMRNALPTLVSHLEKLGYTTTAMHPYYASGWNREKVYGDLMGFDASYFLPDFNNIRYIRKYTSDATCFNKVTDILDDDTQPQFIFNVTMQNHGSYSKDYDNFIPDVTVEGSDSAILSKYLSLVKKTDAAFEQLTQQLQERERPVIVLLFGDHQPNSTVANPVLALSGRRVSVLSEEEENLQYMVPYVMWANFDLDKTAASFASNGAKSEENSGLLTDNDMSVNYLSGKLLQAADVPLSDYQKFLQDVQAQYPVISGWRTYAVPDADATMLESYRKMAYYRLLDAEK